MKRLSLCAALAVALCFTNAHGQLSGSTQATNYQNNSEHTGFAQVPNFAPPLRQKWAVNFGQPASYPVIADGRVFVTVRKPSSTYGTKLYSLDAATGEIMWSKDLGGTYWWSALCYENGRVFALNYDGMLRAYSAWDGDLVWSRQLTGQWSFDSAPTVGGGIIYTAGAGSAGTLYAVSADTGAVLWTAPVANGNSSSPALGIEGVYVSYACLRAYGFAPGDGSLLWRNVTGCSGGGGKTTALHNNRLYARDSSLGNAVFDAWTGAQTGTFVSRTIPAFRGTTGFFMNGQQSSLGSKLEARDLEGNNLLWSFGGDGRLMTAPLVVNDHVYVGSTTGKLYALDKATGNEAWSTSVGSELAINDEHGVGQPPAGLASADGLLVVPTKTALVAYERDLDAIVQWGERFPAPNAAGWNNTSVTLPFTVDQSGGHLDYSPEGPLRFFEEGANQTQDVSVELSPAGIFRTYTSPAVNIDATEPSTVAQLSGPAGPLNDGWYVGPVTVTLAATDNVSGVRETTFELNGPPETYTGPFTLSADGLYALSFRSVDRADNEERTQSLFFAIDANPPVTQATASGTAGANGWYKSAVEVTLSADDGDGAGLDAIYYSIDGGPAQAYAYTPIVVSGAGAHSVSYWSTDVAGHTEAARTLAVQIDGDAPATQLSAAGTSGGGWYRGEVQISLAAADAHSGVASTYYAVDGGAEQPYAGAFTVSGDGTHTITYRSADRAGNAEAAQSSVVKIDSAAPTTAHSVSGTPSANGWYQTSARVTLTASDALSGVAATYYSVDGGTQQTYSAPFDVPAGAHTVNYWSVDVAGGTEQQRAITVNVDAGAPSTQFSAAGTLGGGGWYRGNVQITLAAADAQSGVATTYYSVDGGPAQTYAGAFTVSGNGRHQVSYWSVDRTGNAETARASEVNIDSTAPTAQNAVTGPVGNSTYFRGPVQFSITAEDNLSGVASIFYRVDGGAAQTYSAPFTVAGDGTHPVEVWSVDVAGNQAGAYTIMIRIDATAPTTQAVVTNAPGDNGWSRGPAQLSLTSSDSLSGVQASYYSVNGGLTQSYTGALTFAAAGVYAVNFWSVDRANNAEATKSVVVRVDAVAPTVTAAASPATRPKGKTNVSVTISGRVTDAVSGARLSGATFSVVDEYGVAQPAGSVMLQPDGSYSFSLSLPATRDSRDSDGHRYTITVRALDAAGNAGTGSAVFTIL